MGVPQNPQVRQMRHPEANHPDALSVAPGGLEKSEPCSRFAGSEGQPGDAGGATADRPHGSISSGLVSGSFPGDQRRPQPCGRGVISVETSPRRHMTDAQRASVAAQIADMRAGARLGYHRVNQYSHSGKNG
jgi:hypothetical protein